MTARLLHTEKLEGVQPKLVSLVYEVVVAVGGHWSIACGVRTDAQQLAEWQKGRPSCEHPQPCALHPIVGRIVTKAKRACESPHGMRLGGGCAVDFAALRDDGTYETAMPRYAALGAYAKRRGFDWGGDWDLKDGPHIEVRNWKAIPLLVPKEKEIVHA